MKAMQRNYSNKQISKTKIKASDRAMGNAMLKTESLYSDLEKYEQLEFKSIKEIIHEKSAHNNL